MPSTRIQSKSARSRRMRPAPQRPPETARQGSRKAKPARMLRQRRAKLSPRGLVLFDRGRSVPRSDSAMLIELLAERLRSQPGLRVVLCGHANLRETARSAALLSLIRARRVAQILTAFGIAESRIAIESAGCAVPVLDDAGKCLTALSRRVEVSLEMAV